MTKPTLTQLVRSMDSDQELYDQWFRHVDYYWGIKQHNKSQAIECLRNGMSNLETYQKVCLE